MLSELHIENIAVIHKATIDFSDGFNVFTGETGAGKTILISAINAVLGGKVYKEMIRHGEDKALVVALFTNVPQNAVEKLTSLGYASENEQILITREIFMDSKSSAKLNGRPITVVMLRQIAELLIDIHGQHDSRELLSPERHLNFIDNFGELQGDIDSFNEEYKKLCAVRSQIEKLRLNEGLKLQRQDILKYQIDEITKAHLHENEDEELTSQRDIIRNSEDINEALGGAYDLLNGGDDYSGIIEQIASLEEYISAASEYVDGFEEYTSKLNDFKYDLEEISVMSRDFLDEQQFDPRMLDKIENRLDQIERLKKKYGETVSDILDYCEKAEIELNDLVFADEKIEKLEQEERELFQKAQKQADVLTEKRRVVSKRFVDLIGRELKLLDMPNVKLMYSYDKKSLSLNGQDDMELLISANVGETPKPLSKIASGGELSRVMLAIKNVLADKDDIGTIIFDEIDTGVSGRAANKIGLKLAQVSQNRQIICVTHLAQVAAFAKTHFKIYKDVLDNRTYTHVVELCHNDRINELARINVGENITALALGTAEEMLGNAQGALSK